MAGIDRNTPIPIEITLHSKSRLLELVFDDGKSFKLSFEFLRVFSPSAEVRGHGPGQETLQTGKRDIGVIAVEPIGNYAIKPRFSDGHESGIYSWDYLYELGVNHDAMWRDYLQRLAASGASRESGSAVERGR